jgi:hypothetical protein
MPAIARLMNLACVALLAVSASGCLFVFSDGTGRYSHGALVKELPPIEPEQVAALKAKAAAAQPEPEVLGNGTRVQRSVESWGWVLSQDRVVVRTPDGGKDRPHIITAKSRGVPAIWQTNEVQVYDAETGIQYANQSRGDYIFALLSTGMIIRPGDDPKVPPENLGPLKRHPEMLDYSRYTGTSLIWGLVAWGTKNGRSFGQVLWIPFAVGTAEPATDKPLPDLPQAAPKKEVPPAPATS